MIKCSICNIQDSNLWFFNTPDIFTCGNCASFIRFKSIDKLPPHIARKLINKGKYFNGCLFEFFNFAGNFYLDGDLLTKKIPRCNICESDVPIKLFKLRYNDIDYNICGKCLEIDGIFSLLLI